MTDAYLRVYSMYESLESIIVSVYIVWGHEFRLLYELDDRWCE